MWSPYISCCISDIRDMVLHVHTHIYIYIYTYNYVYIYIGVCIHIPLRTRVIGIGPSMSCLCFQIPEIFSEHLPSPKTRNRSPKGPNIYRLTPLWSTTRHTTDKRNARDRQIGMLCTTYIKGRISGELLQWDDRQTCVLIRVLHHPWFA